MAWTTLITTPGEAASAREKLAEIAAALEQYVARIAPIGLLNGRTGIALFFFNYARLASEPQYTELGRDILSGVFEEIDSQAVLHTFCSGLAGVGWALEHLSRQGFISGHLEDLLTDLDVFLTEALQRSLAENDLDYLHGALGYGSYFLSRLKAGSRLCKKALTALTAELDKRAQRTAQGSAWESLINPETGVTGVNLGLSHGLPSIIAFLGNTAAAGVETEKCQKLLTGAVNFLLAHRLDPGTHGCSFPGWLSVEHPSGKSRLAWCYGDPGIAASLWMTGRRMKDRNLEKTAHEILLASTSRREPVEAGIGDAGVCHGAAGVAHIYNRAFHHSNDPRFAESARFWFRETLRMAYYPDGLAGYKAWSAPRGWNNEPDVLAGVAGIGLTLISAISDLEPSWDEALLLS